jgi:hypothetical protein
VLRCDFVAVTAYFSGGSRDMKALRFLERAATPGLNKTRSDSRNHFYVCIKRRETI